MKLARRFFLYTVVVALASVVSASLWAQTGTGNIVGVVRNADGSPLVNAKVSSLYFAGGPLESVVYSDATGRFVFSGMPVGKSVSIVVYDANNKLIGKGTATVGSSGDNVTVTIQPVAAAPQG